MRDTSTPGAGAAPRRTARRSSPNAVRNELAAGDVGGGHRRIDRHGLRGHQRRVAPHLARRDARIDVRRQPAAGVEHHARAPRLRAQRGDLSQRRDQRAVRADVLQREVGARRLAGGVAADRHAGRAPRHVHGRGRGSRRRGDLLAEPEDRRPSGRARDPPCCPRRARRSRCRRRPARRSSRRRPSPSRSAPTAKSSTGSDFSGRSSPEPAKAECCSSCQAVAVSRSTNPSAGRG